MSEGGGADDIAFDKIDHVEIHGEQFGRGPARGEDGLPAST